MRSRSLPRSRLDALVPSLVAEQALVALVPATGDLKWAGAAAWDVARAAAQSDRRVALVDLWLEDPRLHEVVGLSPTEGIVDAFEYDVSLTKTAHEIDHVFFIAGGSATAHPGDLFANPRWQKLHGGFRVEGALFLLYLSAGALVRLSAIPDGLLVLAPEGFEPESSIGQGITAAMERGIPLLGVVRERWTAPTAALPAPSPPERRRVRSAVAIGAGTPPRRRTRPAVIVVTLAAGASGGWALLARGAEHRPIAPAATPQPSPSPSPSPSPALATAPTPPARRADSLPWTMQLAAYARLDKALALGDRLAAGGITPFVTPIALEGGRGRDGGAGGGRGGGGGGGGSATVWYRVLAGAYPTRDSALAARRTVWRRGLAARGQGDALHAPYTLALGREAAADSLRARGIPAVPWGPPPGRLLVGAFETPEQASLTEARLQRAGLRATLIIRMGTRP